MFFTATVLATESAALPVVKSIGLFALFFELKFILTVAPIVGSPPMNKPLSGLRRLLCG